MGVIKDMNTIRAAYHFEWNHMDPLKLILESDNDDIMYIKVDLEGSYSPCQLKFKYGVQNTGNLNVFASLTNQKPS